MPLSTELDELIAACRRYEPAAQRQLYARYAALMLGIARRYTRSQDEAEDILQDAFIKVFTRLTEFRGEGSFEGWMRRIVVNTALNHWQSGPHRRQPMRLGVVEVLALMEQLPDGCRMVLNLYAVDGYSHGEIAELLGIQESTSKAQLSKARKQLHLLHQRQTSYYRL
jgi:RNA polymerase sigma-70 factor (ECF subfamily)